MTLPGGAIIVAGGTGNIGSFIVRGLLARDAIVVVPSRSEQGLGALRERLAGDLEPGWSERLLTFVGNVGEATGAERLRDQIVERAGPPSAVVASLGGWVPAPSLIEATHADLQTAVDGYLHAHLACSRVFLPALQGGGGTYVFINGPLAFKPWPGLGAGLVSMVTAGQHMLFRYLAQEHEGNSVRALELVAHSFVANWKTLPGSPIQAEDVSTYLAYLLSDHCEHAHGESIDLSSPAKVEEVRAFV